MCISTAERGPSPVGCASFALGYLLASISEPEFARFPLEEEGFQLMVPL